VDLLFIITKLNIKWNTCRWVVCHVYYHACACTLFSVGTMCKETEHLFLTEQKKRMNHWLTNEETLTTGGYKTNPRSKTLQRIISFVACTRYWVISIHTSRFSRPEENIDALGSLTSWADNNMLTILWWKKSTLKKSLLFYVCTWKNSH
jgi:hypothetical protein